MKLGLGLGVNSITSQKIGAGFTGILDEYSGAAAAYSVRRLSSSYTDGLIRVRRSSDDTEQDIGFDSNGDLDSTALLAFVNEDVNQYTSDFSSTEDLFESNGTGAAAQSVGGVDDAYKFTLSGGSNSHFSGLANFIDTGANVSVSFDYYIPSTNSKVDTIGLYSCSPTLAETQIDQWASVSNFETTLNSDDFYFFAKKATDPVNTLDADGDVFYLKNIVVTQTTADGAVTTWYDQSGNGNDATNATESEQPLIVDGGSVAQFDGINAVEFNGTSHELAASLSLSTTAFSSFSVAGTDGAAGTNAQAIFGSNATAFYSQIRSYDLETRISTSPILTLDDDIGNNPNQMQLFASINGTSAGNQYIDGTIGNQSPLDTSSSGGISETSVYIGSVNGQRYLGGGISEIIIFDSDQSSNRTGMETNINDHFDIYS